MTPVNQSIVDSDVGDCARASIATLLDLNIDQVPNFRRFKSNWFDVYYYYLYSLGWEYVGYGRPSKHELKSENSINGYFDAAVASKTFEGKLHAVVIDAEGNVVHDPNPNKKWQGLNVVQTKELKGWYMFKKRGG